MPEDRTLPQPQDENVERNSENETDRFESDTQKLVRQHMEDKNHVITEEEIANVRVGMMPPEFDEATEARFGGGDALDKAEEDALGEPGDTMSEDKNLEDDQITPLDTIDTRE